MTRKDYKLIADVLARVMPEGTRAMIVKQMAIALKQDNPRFNETLFYKACQTEWLNNPSK